MDQNQVGGLYYDIDITDDNLNARLDKSDQKVQEFGKSVEAAGEKIQAGLKVAGAVLAATGAAVTLYAKNATDATVGMVKDARALGREIGVSTTEASRLTAALGKMGIEASSARQMFGIFSKQITAASEASDQNRVANEKLMVQIEKTKFAIAQTTAEIAKNGDADGSLSLKLKDLNATLATQEQQLNMTANSFDKLGISTKNADGSQKSFNELLFAVADKFQAMPDGVEKTTIALDLFGRSGKDLIKVLNLGSGGIADLEKEADRLGLTLNEKTITNVSKLIESQKQLKQQSDQLKIAVGTLTAPVLTKFNTEVNNLLGGLIAVDSPFRNLVANALAFGGPILTAIGGFVAFVGAMVTAAPAFTALGLTVGGLVTGFATFLGVAAAIGAVVHTVVQAMGGWQAVGQMLGQVFNGLILPALQLLWGQIQGSLVPALQRLWEIISPVLMPVLQALGTFIGGSLVGAILIAIGVLTTIISVISFFIQILTTLIQVAATVAGGVINAFMTIQGAIVSVVSFVVNQFARFGTGAQSAVQTVKNILTGVPGIIMGAIGNLGNILFDAGKSILQGLANGIKAAADVPKKAMEGVLDKVKNLLPHSPAKEGPFSGKGWTLYSGRALVDGFAEGIEDQASSAYNSLSSVLNQMSTLVATPSAYMSGISGGSALSSAYASPLAAGGSGLQQSSGDTIVNIGEVNNKQDENYVIRRLDRNQSLASMGISA